MDRKKKHALLLGLSLVILGGALLLCYFQGWLPQANAQETTTQRSTILMDTVVDVRVDGRNSQALVEQAFERMAELEALFSRFVPESEVSAINRGAGDWVKVSPLTLELIELGLEMGRLTEGAFDITIGAVLDLWGFGGDIRRVPGEEELAEALATVDYTKVEVDREAGAVRIPQGTVLDLGGIAKGFIVGRAVEILREAGVERALVNAGGDIAVVGRRPDGNPWRVGVQDPDEPTNIRFILPLDDQSVVTSGDYQRFFTVDGVRYHHILDPRTGYPARGLRSVTIVGADPAVGDAISTAVFVLGWEGGRALVERLPGVEAIVVSDTATWISPGLAQAVTTR